MKKLIMINKDYQAEFQVIHQQHEQLKKECMNPTELKRDLEQLQQEREQLMIKINAKNKLNTSPDFQNMLEATNLLRRVQNQFF